MKRAIIFRVLILSIIVVLGLMCSFIKQKNTTSEYMELNELWIMTLENTEQIYREKSRNMLQQGKHCINEIMSNESIELGFDDKLFYAIDTCMKKARTTQTGDSFAFRTTDYMFVYDPSLDCFVDGGKKFYDRHDSEEIKKRIDNGSKEEFPECYLHQEPELCFKARQELTSGYDSKMGNDIGWRFDDAEEWLEWAVLPLESYGFNGIARGNERLKPYQVVLALGIQSDEVLNRGVIDKYFEKLFNDMEHNKDFENMFVKALIFICILFVLITTMVDYHITQKIECPYENENCPNNGKEV